MSHASGTAKFKDGTTLYFEYNGTIDLALPFLYRTSEELEENWRRSDTTSCICGSESEEVYLHTVYGNGFGWESTACIKCMCITGKRNNDPGEEEYYTGGFIV